MKGSAQRKQERKPEGVSLLSFGFKALQGDLAQIYSRGAIGLRVKSKEKVGRGDSGFIPTLPFTNLSVSDQESPFTRALVCGTKSLRAGSFKSTRQKASKKLGTESRQKGALFFH